MSIPQRSLLLGAREASTEIAKRGWSGAEPQGQGVVQSARCRLPAPGVAGPQSWAGRPAFMGSPGCRKASVERRNLSVSSRGLPRLRRRRSGVERAPRALAKACCPCARGSPHSLVWGERHRKRQHKTGGIGVPRRASAAGSASPGVIVAGAKTHWRAGFGGSVHAEHGVACVRVGAKPCLWGQGCGAPPVPGGGEPHSVVWRVSERTLRGLSLPAIDAIALFAMVEIGKGGGRGWHRRGRRSLVPSPRDPITKPEA